MGFNDKRTYDHKVAGVKPVVKDLTAEDMSPHTPAELTALPGQILVAGC